ncbi:MAG TPA: xanthine dehydrogenase family protein molybdopterin-binding subunit [Acidimicrobiales bacterium]|nr:xanthine dehydrogenase family protein molybdopterin-binding subunit [Acidimicrobiales bacterium]
MLTGPFVADLRADGALELVYVRSPHASARIAGIDVAAAARAPGVVAVLTAGDLPIVPLWEIALIPEQYAQPPLADGAVRYVGERVVAIVATSYAAAVDAAELVEVVYEPLAPVTTAAGATACLEWPSDGVLDEAACGDVCVRLELRIPRVSVAPMEGHAVLAVPRDDGGLTLWASTQVPTAAQRQVCRSLGLAPSQVRVVAPAVGGGFGGKAAGAMADHMIAAAAARALRRPVRFVEDRGPNLTTMQGRGVQTSVSLHATASGELTGLTARIVADAGAYPNVGAVEPGKTRMMLCGPYRLRAVDAAARAVVTNLPPVGAYRGPGRSEASMMLERAVDEVAALLGMDPLELRRRNVIAPSAFPYAAPTGVEYDSGDYPALLTTLAEAAGYERLRREQSARRGHRRLGIGVALVVDSTAWFSRVESAAVRADADGTVVVRAGTASAGQRHDALYRAIVRSVLPVGDDEVRVVEGDTGEWDASEGTMGSRTTQMGGGAVLEAAHTVAAVLRRLAAEALEASADDIVAHPGRGFGVRGVPSSALGVAALVARARQPVEAACTYEQPGASYPAAAHLSVVEVDTETGAVVALRHVAVTDCGRVIDAASARAQVIGATVQGIAQALYEEAVFDADGTPRCASLAEYGVPAAADVPPIEVHFIETPSPRNPLGAKGVGEIGMLAAPAAVMNAVTDALRPLGASHIDMPCTPQAVWAALSAGRAR